VLLATPYLYTYDLVVLAVPLAFLLRFGTARGFLPWDLMGIGVACGLVLVFPFVKLPVGFAALLVVAALLARRIIRPPARPREPGRNAPPLRATSSLFQFQPWFAYVASQHNPRHIEPG
jgi:membrane protein implicated in regulation of membrane protease activity